MIAYTTETTFDFSGDLHAYYHLTATDFSGNGPTSAGTHTVTWAGFDGRGRPVPSGTYFYQLESGEFERTRQAIVLR